MAQQAGFEKLKELMCKSPVLIQPDFEKKFYLQTDASAYGVGAILSQEGEKSPSLTKCQKPVLHPVGYYSATFIPVERNYDIYESVTAEVDETLILAYSQE